MEEEEIPSLPKVREAQKVTGELLWLSGKARPDISWAVMHMAQCAVKKPRWTILLGQAVLAYIKHTVNYGLHYSKEVPVDADPDLQRRKPRHRGTLEVLVDASFGPGDGHSITGTIVLLAGAPIQWESHKQSLMSLSTAEAELTALVEGLHGRSVRALVSLLLEKVELELFNDNRAAIILASGSGGGWRTRHLKIRASTLAEAVKLKELSLDHRPGTSLWADALTKALPTQSLERFCAGIGLGDSEMFKETTEKKDRHSTPSQDSMKLMKSISLLAVGASMMPGSMAAETPAEGQCASTPESSSWVDHGWLLMLAGLVCLLHLAKDLGWSLAKRLVSKEEAFEGDASQ